MQQYRNWNNVQAAGEFKPLKPGGYVLQIKAAREETSRNGNPMLVIAFDIAEGEFKGYYNDLFAKNTAADRKWPNGGIHRIMLPVDNGTDEDNKQMSKLKGFVNAVAESNRNYNPNEYWNIEQLKGKLVGGLFRREEYENQKGERKWTTKLAWPCSVPRIKSGDFEVPEDRPLPETTSNTYGAFPQAPANSYPPNPYANAPIAQDDPFGGQQGFVPIDNEIEDDSDLPF